MEELELFAGDNIKLKGKKRKTTVAIINGDDSIASNKVCMTKMMRSNLR
jgi:transitional endoplasmic reticulum ATPase